MRRSSEAGDVGLGQPGDEVASGATNSSHRACEGSLRMWNQSPGRGAGREDKIQIRRSSLQSFRYKVKPFSHEAIQAVEQAVKKGCAVCFPGGFQDPAGQIPEQSGMITQLTLL